MLIQLGMALLRQFISIGVLEISINGCKTHHLKADRSGSAVHLELASRRLFWRIVLKPDLALVRPIWMDHFGSAMAVLTN